MFIYIIIQKLIWIKLELPLVKINNGNIYKGSVFLLFINVIHISTMAIEKDDFELVVEIR